MTLQFLERNDPLSRANRYRSRLAADAKFDGVDGLETQTVYQGNLGAGATTLYTCPTKKRARTGGGVVLLHNPTAGTITADVHLVPAGDSVTTSNKLAATVTVGIGETRLYFDRTIRMVVMSGASLVINTGGAGLNGWMWALEERKELCAFYGGFLNLTTSEATILTVPAMQAFYMENLVAYNLNANTRTLTLHVRESGIAAGTTNQIETQPLLTLTGYTLLTGLLPSLSENGLVSGIADNTGINVWINGALL